MVLSHAIIAARTSDTPRSYDGLKLGRARRAGDKPRLALASYLRPEALPPAPTAWDGYRGGRAAPRMFGNDVLGDCTIAGLANHARMRASLDGDVLPEFTDDEVAAYYKLLTGGPDTGLDEYDVLAHAVTAGFPLDGRYKFRAQVSVDVHNEEHVALAASLFGGLYLGLLLPTRAQTQGAHWQVGGDGLTGDDAPGSWGGHCAILSGFDRTPSPWDKPGAPTGNASLLTWGDVVFATRHWLATYCDEAYAILDERHLALPGIDGAALLADLAALRVA